MSELLVNPPLMVVTDLDGTLLDHFDYSFEAAKPAMERLKALDIPLILNTSKTYIEVSSIQEALGIDTACIIENGSAVYVPEAMEAKIKRFRFEEDLRVSRYFVKRFGLSRETIVAKLQHLRSNSGYLFQGFSDWTAEQVSNITGLTIEEARKAKIRHFSEPIIWKDSDLRYEQFVEDVNHAGLMLLKGGRFIHVMGHCDKGKTMNWLKSLYSDLTPGGRPSKVVALGDSQNDVAMLQLADIAVVVKSPAHDFPAISPHHGEVIYTTKLGPQGWNEAMMKLLDALESDSINTEINKHRE